jgi:hypothetical protein
MFRVLTPGVCMAQVHVFAAPGDHHRHCNCSAQPAR